MGELKNTKQTQAEHEMKLLKPDMLEKLHETFVTAEKKLLILDYDGTLRSFVDSTNPSKAAPSVELLAILKKLSSIPNTEICIISGRPKEALDEWFDKLPLSLVAEHGAWTKKDGKWVEVQTSFNDHKSELLNLMNRYAKRTTGSVVEKKSNSLVWHYRKVKPELAFARNVNLTKDIEKYIKDTDLSVFHGNKIIEVKPESINKGRAALDLYTKHRPDFTMCIGDDYTDEDMFDVLPEQSFTVKVGLEETQALFQVRNVDEVLSLLKKLSRK
jgi:trehalose 6-phosphate synthase/phosphatase